MSSLMLLAAYSTGIAMAFCIPTGSVAGYGLLIAILILLWSLSFRSPLAWIPLVGLILITGYLNTRQQLVPPQTGSRIECFADNTPQRLEGELLSIEKQVDGGYHLLVSMRQILGEKHSIQVVGKLLLYLKEGRLQARPGQIIRWRAKIRAPKSFGNPGEFDYPLYLAAQGIYATAFLTNAEELVTLVNHPERATLSLENWRYSMSERIDDVVAEDAAGLLQALLLGLRGGISETQRRTLADAGLSHLFAISGLHFGLLALLLYQIGKLCYTRSQRLLLCCPPQRILPLLLILPLACYLLLSGNSWATRRAFLMISAMALLFAWGRRTSPCALLASVALCLLLFNPLALLQPGFQLSFAGVAGIMIWLPRWSQPCANLPPWLRWPITLFLTTAAATLATAPAALWHFHQFAPAGLLTNLIAIPMLAWAAVPAGLISMAASPFSTTLADWGLQLAGKLVALAIDLAAAVSSWPGLGVTHIYLTSAGLILIIAAVLSLLPTGQLKRPWRVRFSLFSVAFALFYVMRPLPADFRITAFSVGQGDATLVTLAENQHFLVDGGGLPGSAIDPGERLIAPALGRMGITSLQGVILTHNHPDHSSGLVYLLDRFPVKTFYLAEQFSKLDYELKKVLQERAINIFFLPPGWTPLVKNKQQTLSLFTPSQQARDRNERSVAVFAGQGAEGVLLSADLGSQGLQQLLAAGLPGPVSLLKLPHHGSRLAKPDAYLDSLQPGLAFVSAGRDNIYGFPHQQTIDACQRRQIPLYRTDELGMLTFCINNGKLQNESGRAF